MHLPLGRDGKKKVCVILGAGASAVTRQVPREDPRARWTTMPPALGADRCIQVEVRCRVVGNMLLLLFAG